MFSVQVLKVRKVVQGLVGNLVQMENQDQEDLKVLKECQVHLDQDLKDFLERRYYNHTETHYCNMGNRYLFNNLCQLNR